MNEDFHNRTDWLAVILAMAIWAAHFLLVWAASSAFPGLPAARWTAAGLSLAAFLALFVLWRWRKAATLRSAAGLSIVLAAGGVAYDLLPAILG